MEDEERGLASAALRAYLPGAEGGTSATATGPLQGPVLRDPEMLREFLLATTNDGEHLARRLLTTPAGAAAVSLTMDLIQSGALGGDAALTILRRATTNAPPLLAIDALRIGAALWPRRTEATKEPHWWAMSVAKVVRGILRGDPNRRLPLASTREELVSLVAVVRFALTFLYDPDFQRRSLIDSGDDPPGGEPWAMVANRHLEALLRERPEDLDRIIAHCREHVPDRSDTEAVGLIRGWLDAGAPALDSGWL